jgi:hypothetical protein
MAEAADLGVALVQRHRASIWRCHAPLLAAVVLLAAATVEISPWLPDLIVFCLKPWMDRAILFVLSRAAFGETTRFSDLWRERRAVLWQGLLPALTLARISPWRAYTQPLRQLEGQRGKALRQRYAQMLRYKRPAAAGMQFVFAQAEMALIFAAFSLAFWFAPEGSRGDVWQLLMGSPGVGVEFAGLLVYAGVVLMLEPFYVASGFAMYLNRRVELEAWDVEQEFRRAFH